MAKTKSREELERHVLGVVIGRMKAIAAATGRDHWDLASDAKAVFPGVPSDIIWEAALMLDDANAEAWWFALEKTIEGEAVRNALSLPQSAEAGDGSRWPVGHHLHDDIPY
jgi:hypothetical protein